MIFRTALDLILLSSFSLCPPLVSSYLARPKIFRISASSTDLIYLNLFFFHVSFSSHVCPSVVSAFIRHAVLINAERLSNLRQQPNSLTAQQPNSPTAQLLNSQLFWFISTDVYNVNFHLTIVGLKLFIINIISAISHHCP